MQTCVCMSPNLFAIHDYMDVLHSSQVSHFYLIIDINFNLKCESDILNRHMAGGYLLGRTIAILFVMTLATSMAARQGAIKMAGHQICMQIWLAASLLSDSLALSGQVCCA